MSGIQALLVKNEYPDLEMLSMYDVDRVFFDYSIQLVGNKRRYRSSSFVLIVDGERLTHTEAYNFYRMNMKNRRIRQ